MGSLSGPKSNCFFSVKAMMLFLAVLVAAGEASACRLALVFAIDVSKSVDSADYDLQFQGLASALRDEEVQAAILNRREPVAVIAFEWSGAGHQTVVADWSLLMNPHHVGRFATKLERHQRTYRGQRTAIGSAIAFADTLFLGGPSCARRVIDISSDGYNNEGRRPGQVYVSYNLSEVTVNALVIGGLKRPELQRYFEAKVIRGPRAFALGTESFADYPETIRRKLLRELLPNDAVAVAPR